MLSPKSSEKRFCFPFDSLHTFAMDLFIGLHMNTRNKQALDER